MSARVRVAVLLLAAWVAACATGPAWLLLAVALVAQGGRMVRVDLLEHGTGVGR